MNGPWRRLILACGLIALAFFAPACSSDDDEDALTDPGGGEEDTTAPTVTAVYPEDGALEVSTAGTIMINFSEPMDPSDPSAHISMSEGSLLLTDWLGDSDLVIEYEGWPEAAEVTVLVGTGLTDVAGNQLTAPLSLSYWTMASTLMVLEHTPAAGATDVNRAASIELLFSSQVISSSLATGVTIADDTRAPVPFTVEDIDAYRFRLHPEEPLAASSEITVTVGTDVQSSQGSLAEPYVFTFTTGEVLDQTPPTIVSIDPPSGSTLPANQSAITITFDEPIDTVDFAPTFLSGQFAYLLSQADQEPEWDMDQMVLTVDLPADLPAGLPLRVVFAGYADANGNVQSGETEWTGTVAGTADPYPVWDGRRWLTMGEWSEGDVGSAVPTGSGDEMVWYEFRARGTAGQWDRVEYYDEWLTQDYYEIQNVSASGIEVAGFAETDDGFTERFVSSPLSILELPFEADNQWTDSATITTPDGTLSVSGTAMVVGQEDLAFAFEGFEVVWTDVWRVELAIELRVGGSLIGTDATTYWYAPGVGIVRETYREEDLEEDTWFEYDRWLQIGLD